MLLWVRTTPFGTPVEPLVYIIIAVSSGLGGYSSNLEALKKNIFD